MNIVLCACVKMLMILVLTSSMTEISVTLLPDWCFKLLLARLIALLLSKLKAVDIQRSNINILHLILVCLFHYCA